MENCPKDSLKTYVRDRAGPVAVGPRETGDGRVIDWGYRGAALPEGDREIRAEESPGPPARHLWDKARREGMGDWGKGDPSRAGNGRMAARRPVPVSAGAASRASAAEKKCGCVQQRCYAESPLQTEYIPMPVFPHIRQGKDWIDSRHRQPLASRRFRQKRSKKM